MDVKKLFIVLLAIFYFSLSLRLLTINDIGRTYDEWQYIEQGHGMVRLLVAGDIGNSYFYTTYDHPPLVKYLYGLVAYFDVEKIGEGGETLFYYDLTASRFLSALIFSIGVVLTVIIGWRVFSPFIGIVSGIILAMLPFSLGLSQLVTAESFKILIYPLTILFFLQLLKNYSIKNIVLLGIALGVALQIKQSNSLLLLIFALTFYLQYKTLKGNEKHTYLKDRVVGLGTIIILSLFTFVAIWPHIIFHFPEVYAIHQGLWDVQFSLKPWQITLAPPEIFFGRLMLAPVFYYVVYLFISIPVLIVTMLFVGIAKIYKEGSINKLVILFWFLIPFLMSFYSWRQHGLRYIIEIYPALAIIAAVGFSSLTAKFPVKKLGRALATAILVLYLFANLWYVRPYYLDYFNELVGGTGTVWKYNLFQTGWWGQGLREASLYVSKRAEQGNNIGLAVFPNHSVMYSNALNYEDWEREKKYDYVIVSNYHIIRHGFDDAEIKMNYDLAYEVKADGATLVYIYKKK